MFDVQSFKETYPDWFYATPDDAFALLFIFVIPFLITFLYIRFFESRLVLFFESIIVPFLRFRLRLEKPFKLIKNILGFQIFRIPRAKT
ncbi:Uncharacterised protein [uncultured archaeon]|nr:Uncharacterised protein [uncultured archaeon]